MKTMIRTAFVIILGICICLPASIFGQADEARKHEGFFLRFLLGGGPSSIVLKDVEGSDMKFKPTGSDFHIQIGKSVGENLIVYGDLGGLSLFDPDVEWKGDTATSEDVSVSAFGFGAGVTYYMMPSNIFVSGSILAVKNSLEYGDNIEAEGEYGFGLLLSAGKEWWISDKWALGGGIYFEFSSTKDKKDAFGNQTKIKNSSFGIMFSATMD